MVSVASRSGNRNRLAPTSVKDDEVEPEVEDDEDDSDSEPLPPLAVTKRVTSAKRMLKKSRGGLRRMLMRDVRRWDVVSSDAEEEGEGEADEEV